MRKFSPSVRLQHIAIQPARRRGATMAQTPLPAINRDEVEAAAARMPARAVPPCSLPLSEEAIVRVFL